MRRRDDGRATQGRDLASRIRPGRAASGLDGLVADLLDAQLLRMAVGASFGAGVLRGLTASEVGATLSLAARAPSDRRQLRAKTAALSSCATRSSSTGLLKAMVAAALEHNERRVASAEARAAVRGMRPPAQATAEGTRPERPRTRASDGRRAPMMDRPR